MANAGGKGWIGGSLAGLALALVLLPAVPAAAQETPDQFDAANAENRRHSEALNQLRNQAHDLRNDRAKALLQCQGAGTAAARNACASNVEIDLRRRDLDLGNRLLQERNSHDLILKGIGVHRVP
jgi:hypothetical protein